MKKLASIMLVAGALVCAATAPSQARESHDDRGRAVEHRRAEDHRTGGEHRAWQEHRGVDRHEGHAFFGWGAAYPYGGYEAQPYAYAPPPISYFCPTYGAYYPSVVSCPVPWVPVTP